jgi:hypothetical protein
MANNHIITKNIGNLRGFSTDSIYLRPSNVADTAINIQRAPDGTLQLRRGYQCQIAEIGGMGTGTFNDPIAEAIQTVTIGTDGFLYQKQEKQIYFDYDGQVTGTITNITQAVLAQVTSPLHGLQTGAIIIIRNVNGMTNVNNNTYTITVVDPNNFTLDGVNSTTFSAYISGGEWSISFADNRYLTITIFTDPRFLSTNPGWSVAPWSFSPWGAPSGESITCNITVNRAAQISANATNVNTVSVQFGHELVATDVIQFYASNGVFNQRNVISVTPTSITFDGYPVTVVAGVYISQFFDIPFRKGFDVTSPYLISTFIATITNPTTGVHGLLVSVNGDTNYPAAFLQIFEPMIVDSNQTFTLNYWYWQVVHSTVNPPFPGSANIRYQNSPTFENASFAAFDDVMYIANGWDFPQKFDGQTVYRTGMPLGNRPSVIDNTTSTIQPFVMGNTYEYAITYEQVDNRGHIVEGEVSEVWPHTIGAATAAMDVTVTNLLPGSSWNTNGALATIAAASVYGPDGEGFYYDLNTVNSGYTLKIGDSAYYLDSSCAQVDGAQANVVTITVDAGHNVLVGETVYFESTTPNEIVRVVSVVTPTTITITGDPVTVADNSFIMVYKVSKVFGNVAIVDLTQSNVNTINVLNGVGNNHTIQIGDVVEFFDTNDLLQRRNVVAPVTLTTITVDGNPVDVTDKVLIASLNQRATQINLQRTNFGPATPDTMTTLTFAPISNNLRINIYRTLQGQSFGVNGELFLVASIPNNSDGTAVQVYVDDIADAELGRQFDDPDQLPNPPPISKYLKAFGNQLFYAGGARGNPENSDRVFFSQGNEPESVALASNFFNVPNVDDDITGIGVAGTTLVTTKNQSLWAATGNFLSGQIDVVQIAPGTNIGCVAHATIASVGTLMYFLHTNGVYAITENQLYPTDPFGNPIPLSLAIDALFRTTNFLPQTRYQYKRAVALNYTKDNQYLLFLPCEDSQSTIRTANAFSTILCYDYQEKNWFPWFNMNAAGGMFVINDDLYFQERRFSAVDGNTANLYKQHRFYRLIDHADHAGPQRAEWKSSWEDLGQPEVRKKFCRCVLLLDRLSELYQYNNPEMFFSTYLNRLPNLQSTMAEIFQTDNIRNSSWSYSGWGWNYWSGYQDSFITINLKQGTVAKSIQVGFALQGINMDIRLAGFQLEAIPENRKSVLR